MTDFINLLKIIKQVRDSIEVQIDAETNPEIRAGMEINLDLLSRALADAGWEE